MFLPLMNIQASLLLIPMVFGLGVRHGFDLDHLATIDAITRTISTHKWLAKCVGVLFSFGHGLIVTSVSVIIGSGLMHSHPASWLTRFGALTSIIFLFTFGILNLFNIFKWNSAHTLPTSLRGALIRKITRNYNNPLWIVGIGALFAISFDTFSQVALFSISAAVFAGWLYSGMLGIIFMLGMIVADGLNGWIVSLLIQRADTMSRIISRCLSLVIASFSLCTGAIGLIKLYA